MIKHDQLQNGLMYSYRIDGEEKKAIVTQISLRAKIKTVILDNGDTIPVHIFLAMADIVLDQPINENNAEDYMDNVVTDDINPLDSDEEDLSNHPDAGGRGEMPGLSVPRMDIRLDANGIPILEFDNNEESLDIIVPNAEQVYHSGQGDVVSAMRKVNDPIFQILDKASSTDTSIQVSINVKLISKELIEVLKTSFPESHDSILEYFLNNLSVGDIKNAVKNHLAGHYGVKFGNEKE